MTGRLPERRCVAGRVPVASWAGSAALLSIVCACGVEPAQGVAVEDTESGKWADLPPVTKPDPQLDALGHRLETIERVCARGRADPFARALCAAEEPPAIQSIGELLALVGLDDGGSRAFALTGNSTSLVARHVSPINPRLVVFPRVGSDLEPPAELTALGFVRGEPFVELVSRDVVTGELDFYLLVFERSCSYDAAGCDLASLLTEEIESGWTAYSVYDHDDLESTTFDCLSCHRNGPPGTSHILRMQELESPWLHWFPQRFGQRTESDRVLLAQFAEAHGSEGNYGGIAVETITNALDEGSGAQLEALVRAEGFAEQPNPFDAQIAAEARTGDSPAWQARFDAHLQGQAIAVPYPGVDVTDEAKRAAAVSSYVGVVTGAAPRETLIDVRDVFSHDAAERLSFVPWPGADGRRVLLQMCARCHDGRGNPALAKNRFDVSRLDEMSREIKDTAITRLTATGHLRMPPASVGDLTQDALDAAVAELQK